MDRSDSDRTPEDIASHADRRASLLAWAFTTRAGQCAAFCAGAALWFVAAPVLIPLVATAVLCDYLDTKASKRS